jgi:molybdate transport system ATP-binding protein
MSATVPVLDIALRGDFGPFRLDCAFTVPARGVTALFGPSGCGKTSTLRAMAGLAKVAGHVRIGETVWQSETVFLPPHRRAVGYVFQEASLFAHLSVRDNLRYGAKRAGAVADDGFEAEVIALLGLAPLIDRAPDALSGGERQRVAIGRALLSRPRLLLMDEPLAALDRARRDEILPFLERLHATLALPMIYVSHDMAEIERFADHLVLMEAGRVIGSGPLAQLQSDPALPLAAARDAAVMIEGVVTSHDAGYGLLTLAIPGGELLLPGPEMVTGARQRVRVAATDVSLVRERPSGSTISNILPVRIIAITPLSFQEHLVLLGLGADGAGARLIARITRRSADQLGLRAGEAVLAQIKGAALAPAR